MDAPKPKDFPLPTIGPERGLDRKAEKRGDKDWIAARLADPESRFLVLGDLSLAVDSEGPGAPAAIRWHTGDEASALGADFADAVFLGCDNKERAVFALALDALQMARAPGGAEALKPLVDLRSLAMQGALPPDDLSLAALARALAAWHKSSRCCGHCGARTRSREAGWRRSCRACGQEHFPRADPAVIVLITDGARCLLGHHKRYVHKFYSVLAGFVEPGEDIETCVRREMREEAGVEIGAVTYLASQPWPFPHSLMVGCWAEALTTELTLEQEELWDARWFDRAEVAAMLAGRHGEGFTVPGPHSIAHSLIKSFADAAA